MEVCMQIMKRIGSTEFEPRAQKGVAGIDFIIKRIPRSPFVAILMFQFIFRAVGWWLGDRCIPRSFGAIYGHVQESRNAMQGVVGGCFVGGVCMCVHLISLGVF